VSDTEFFPSLPKVAFFFLKINPVLKGLSPKLNAVSLGYEHIHRIYQSTENGNV